MIEAVLFDFDGTLADSMWMWDRLLLDFLKNHNLPVDEKILNDVCHMSMTQSAPYVKERYNLSLTAEEIFDIWMEMAYRAYAEEICLKPGAEEYLRKLKKDGVKLAIVTACDPKLLTACLEHNGVCSLFDTIVYTDDVGKGKNFPDIYIEALRRLGTKAEQSMLFEDIPIALKVGKSIGLQTVAVVREKNGSEAETVGDRCISDFYELL